MASFNVDNLFARPKAFDTTDSSIGKPILKAYRDVADVMAKAAYSSGDKRTIRELLVRLDIYSLNMNGAACRKYTSSPRWAWLRKNRGSFDRQPVDDTQSVEIVANGPSDWIGWVELATEPTDEIATRLTARVITDVNADVLGIGGAVPASRL